MMARPAPERVACGAATKRDVDSVPAGDVDTIDRLPFQTSLATSGMRCVLRYVVFPLLLPMLAASASASADLVTGAALGVLLSLDLAAVVGVAATLRRLWGIRHPHRWTYLLVAVGLTSFIVLFLANDLAIIFT